MFALINDKLLFTSLERAKNVKSRVGNKDQDVSVNEYLYSRQQLGLAFYYSIDFQKFTALKRYRHL